MVQKCVFSGCISGRVKDRNRNRRLNRRNNSIFIVPKCPNMLKLWSSAIKQELAPKDLICELHFNENDIIKDDQIKLTDGRVFISRRKKYSLKPGAIPTFNPNKFCESRSQSSEFEVLNAQFNILPTNNQIISIPHLCQNSSNETDISDKTNDIDKNSLVRIPQLCENSSNETDISDKTNNIIDKKLVKINDPLKFSLDDLERFLESQPLRQKWSWTGNKNSFIRFSYINCKPELECHVRIDKALIVTIVNAKTNVFINMDVKISSIDSVWQLLSTLENSRFCSGTGCDNKKYESTCTGILLPDEKYRCVKCRKLRHSIQKRKIKSVDYKARWMNTKNILTLERRKFRLIVEQLNIYKELGTSLPRFKVDLKALKNSL